MLEYVLDRPTAYLDEIAWFIFDETGISVHPKTIWNVLSRANFSRKASRHVAKERNEQLRTLWRAKSAYWKQDDIIFIDESASNERTGWRKYGWSLCGMPCDNIQPAKRSERWSILPAMSVNGYLLGVMIKQGAVTQQEFTDWIHLVVLPQTTPGQILVMDNASVHKDGDLQALVKLYGVRIEYLPPYSPDYNPIELSFNQLKAWIKRHVEEALAYRTFGDFLANAVSEFDSGAAKAQFEKAGYRYN